jgi:hypothetical protein
MSDHVRKKLLAALACLKYGTVQDRVQFTKDRGSFNIIESAGIAVDSFAPDLVCRRTHDIHRLPFESCCDGASRGLLITLLLPEQVSDDNVAGRRTGEPRPNGPSPQLNPLERYLAQSEGVRRPSSALLLCHHTVTNSFRLENPSTGADGCIPMQQPCMLRSLFI